MSAYFAAWTNFYVIVGSAAAGLTGLMFVAITLIASSPSRRNETATKSFSTPTIVHFSVALGIAAIVSAPWPALWIVALLLGLTGVGGAIYAGWNTWRIIALPRDYQMVLEDWLCYGALPLLAYLALGVAGLLLVGHPTAVLFVIGAVPLALLFIGIHNAWDVVTYVAVTVPQQTTNAPTASVPAQTARD